MYCRSVNNFVLHLKKLVIFRKGKFFDFLYLFPNMICLLFYVCYEIYNKYIFQF